MDLPHQIATHLRQVYFGGNWTSVNLQATLQDVSLSQATHSVGGSHSILALVYHLGYFVREVSKVLQGQPLAAKDAHSFDHPAIATEEAWQEFLGQTWAEAETFAQLIEQLPETRLEEVFVAEKYGTYYANLHGIIEHIHYHLGQMVLLKRLIA